MGRPRLAVGTAGTVTTKPDPAGGYRARCSVRDPDGRLREVSRWRKTKASAERALRDAIAGRQPVGADAIVSPETPFARILEQWLEAVDESDRAVQTKTLYRNTARRHVEPALGELRLAELSVPRLDAALRAIRAGSGVGTAKTSRAVLSGALGLAVRLGAMPTNPIRDVSAGGGSNGKEIRALTLEEEWRVRDWPRSSTRAVDLDLPDLVDWMLGTGMRIGEVCAIRDDVVDLDAGTVEVNATVVRVTRKDAETLDVPAGLYVQERTKSSAGWRVLALPPDLVDMLKARRERLCLVDSRPTMFLDRNNRPREVAAPGLVFTSPAGRLRDTSNTLNDLRWLLDEIDRPDGEDAGPFAWVTSHVFRKTVATRLDDAGMSARQIADVLGHAKPSMTMDLYMGRRVVSADTARILARPAGAS